MHQNGFQNFDFPNVWTQICDDLLHVTHHLMQQQTLLELNCFGLK